MKLRDSIRELLVDARWGRGLTQEELAKRSGLSIRTISDIERGQVLRPRAATLRMLALGLGMDDTETRELLRMAHNSMIIDR